MAVSRNVARAPRHERRLRVLELVEQALRLLEAAGRPEAIGPSRVVMFRHAGFSILHRTPETVIPVPEKLLAAGVSAEEVRRRQGDYGIEMWAGGSRKVLNVVWSEGERPQVVAFARGDWEDELLGLDPARLRLRPEARRDEARSRGKGRHR